VFFCILKKDDVCLKALGRFLAFERAQYFRMGMKTLEHIKDNWKAGLTVALVSLPLSISLAVASKVSPTAGIITAMWAGLVAAIFGGSNFNIIGPTGALSGIIAVYALTNGVRAVALLTLMSGIFILCAYLLKLERYLIFIPSSVMHGFTLGVAFIIGLNQFNYAFGLKNIPQHKQFFANVVESLRHINEFSWISLVIFLSFFSGLLLLRTFAPKIPGAVVLAPVGILIGFLSKLAFVPLRVQTLGDNFFNITFKFFERPSLMWSSSLIGTAAIIALIAILETMLSAKIADTMTHTKHDARKEMLGLGLANLVSGFVGGMPATAALARTSLNIKTRATHKSAAAINVFFIVILSLFFLAYFTYIPLAVIAAILVYVAVQMIEAHHFVTFFRYERTNFWIALIVAAATIGKNPMVGILLGATISLIVVLEKISQGQCDIKISKRNGDVIGALAANAARTFDKTADVVMYSMKGKLCYINSGAHVARFETDLEHYTYIIVRLQEIYFIDLDGVAALDDIIKRAEARGQIIMISSVFPSALALLEQASGGYKKLQKEGLVFKRTHDALSYLEAHYQIALHKKTVTHVDVPLG